MRYARGRALAIIHRRSPKHKLCLPVVVTVELAVRQKAKPVRTQVGQGNEAGQVTRKCQSQCAGDERGGRHPKVCPRTRRRCVHTPSAWLNRGGWCLRGCAPRVVRGKQSRLAVAHDVRKRVQGTGVLPVVPSVVELFACPSLITGFVKRLAWCTGLMVLDLRG